MKKYYAIVFALFLGLTAAATATVPDSFFPTRPSPVTLHTLVGTLLTFNIGNKAGEFRIKQSNGTIVAFFVGYPIKVNGTVTVNCPMPPIGSATPDPTVCTGWPTDIIVGQTSVKATYWTTSYGGSTVKVSDQVDKYP